MSEPLSPLDLKFLPDWLKEAPAPNRYAGYSGGDDDSRSPRSGRGGRSGAGPGGADRDRNRGGGAQRADSVSQRRDSQGRGNERRGSQSQEQRRGPQGSANQRHGGTARPLPPRTDTLPAPVKIQFLPEPTAAGNIAKQIRQSAKAYPLFNTARMFLEKPERHAIRITSSDESHPLHQLNDGPISFDASLLERNAFRNNWSKYYREEVTELEPPKGNYTSVALCRSTGTLLGPTNHHAYQVAVRRLYEERFSRRMSFPQFQRDEIEVVTSEQAVADWKSEQCRQTVYHSLDESDPLQFKSLQDAEVHFRKHHLPKLLKTAASLECSGRAARDLPERALLAAARDAFDKELAYPGGLVHGLRSFFDELGLQVFKHRKRVLYVSAIRPKPAGASSGFAEGPATLLSVIGESPRISKRDLAVKILGSTTSESAEDPEHTARKTQLASDLHYLVHTGHVIEFADGRLDLPLLPSQAADRKDSDSKEVESLVESESGVEHVEHVDETSQPPAV